MTDEYTRKTYADGAFHLHRDPNPLIARDSTQKRNEREKDSIGTWDATPPEDEEWLRLDRNIKPGLYPLGRKPTRERKIQAILFAVPFVSPAIRRGTRRAKITARG